MAVAETITSRRALLGIMAAMPIMAVPVDAAGATPFRRAEARYRRALARFEGLHRDLEEIDPAAYEREQDAFLAAVKAVEQAPVANWREFADAYEHACDGGASLPGDDAVLKFLADVRRLSGGLN